MTEETPGVRFDIERDTRIGLPEAVFCAGKPRAALEGLFRRFADPAEKPILYTRLEESVFAARSGAHHHVPRLDRRAL